MFLKLLSKFELTAGKLIVHTTKYCNCNIIAISLFIFFLLWFALPLFDLVLPLFDLVLYLTPSFYHVCRKLDIWSPGDQVYASQSKSKVWEPQGWFGGPKYRFFKAKEAIGSKVTKVFCRYACFLLFAIGLFTSFLYCNWSLKRKVATIAKQKRINETY